MNTSMKPAEFYREQAKASRKRAAESFDRCDTDGFLTQYAGDMMARVYDAQAEIAEHNGCHSFMGLYTAAGRRVMAKIIETHYGRCWLLHEKEQEIYNKRGQPFIPLGSNSRIQKALGLQELPEMAPAWAKLDSNGTGLSGTCFVRIFRTGCQWGTDAVLIAE